MRNTTGRRLIPYLLPNEPFRSLSLSPSGPTHPIAILHDRKAAVTALAIAAEPPVTGAGAPAKPSIDVMSCSVPSSCTPFPRTPHVKARDSVCFRRHCALSATTVVVDIEKPQTSSLESQSSLSFVKPLTYLGGADSPAKRNFRATWEAEALFTIEEEGIAVAAAEAVALARAALEVAKDAAQMIGHNQSVKLEKSDDFLTEFDILQLERVKLNEMEQDNSAYDSATVGSKTHKTCTSQFPYTDTGTSLFMDQDRQTTHSKSIAVKSGRQTERRARRVRAAGKAADSIVTPKPQSSLKKKRPALQEIDYSDPLRYLRGTTSTSKLLTATEELDLSEGIQVLLKLERLQEELAEKNGCQPTFAQWADAAGIDQRTLRKQLTHGTMCKDKMVKSNIRLVISIAKNYQGVGLNLQDLVQEGCRGLVKGAEKFDASKGFKFSTYAHWWIKQAVRKSLSDQSRTIRLPFHMVDATYRVREATKQLYSENGRYPEKEEVAEATGLTVTRVTAVMLTPKAPRSLDQKIGINESMKPSDVISDPAAKSSEEILMSQFMKEDLDKLLDSLGPREKQVVRWRFGLEDGRMKTLQEIGELMGISRERVRQIESSGFRKLKNKRKTSNLRQYLYL